MTILVTGAAGSLATMWRHAFLARGDTVVGSRQPPTRTTTFAEGGPAARLTMQPDSGS